MDELKELTDKLKKTADEIRDKVDRLNERFDAEPPKTVMPMIANMLNAWDDLPNDVKSDPELERLFRHIQKIDSAMEA